MLKLPGSVVASAVLLAGCAAMGGGSGPMAVANLEPTRGNSAGGKVTFEQRGAMVRVSGSLSGLKPGAEHGFHVHEKGDCSSGDGTSAGGHFNPLAMAHGHHGGSPRHAGDMPNVRADTYGNASFSFETTGITIGSGATDIVGKGLIVHRDPDDYKSQPAGNAGPRIACAVIAKG
ncbi:MAG: superoxide dismutase family protein [Burkholderiales bacterium]